MILLNVIEKKIINNVIEFAKSHPITLKQLEEKSITVGNIKEHVCTLPMSFRVVFSFENQPIGWCRHISISVPDKNKLPSHQAVSMIINEFGFPKDINDQDNVWVETDCTPNAINVIKQVDDKNLLEILNAA